MVEGKYDKSRLKNLVDCPVITTNGFGVFNDSDIVRLIRFYAENGGIIILTDSDSAGFRIRSRIKGIVNKGSVKNAYIPDVFGKEKRKIEPSAEGKLGVEGMSDDIIINALKICIGDCESSCSKRRITSLDLYEDGLCGTKDAAFRRERLQNHLSLPQRLTPKSLLDALNAVIDYDDYKKLVRQVLDEDTTLHNE